MPSQLPKAAFVYSDRFLAYRFGPNHPLRQIRLQMNHRMLAEYGEFTYGSCELVEPISATRSDLLVVHSETYVDALENLSKGIAVRGEERTGFGPGDNPPFPGMFDATLLYVGATKECVRRIVSGENTYCFNNSGGLHHAMRDKAAGFCLANDCALAAQWLVDAGHRVAYIDIDAHHGDGVQSIFYDRPDVLTISLHETPETLFPWVTGFVNEVGVGDGYGFNVNVPMRAGSTDEHYDWAYEEIVTPIIRAFAPTVIVLQVGADGHYDDPLAHLSLSSHGWLSMVRKTLGYGAPIIALGGGGYNIKTVARLWTLLQSTLAGDELPDEVPAAVAKEYGITNLHDTLPLDIPEFRKRDCWDTVREVAKALKSTVFPIHHLCLVIAAGF
jgi:acetoin utilization protein AcuC